MFDLVASLALQSTPYRTLVFKHANMASCFVSALGTLPSETTLTFHDSSFFSRHPGASLPNLQQVLAKSILQNPHLRHDHPRPPPVFFESLDLVVKFGRDENVHISEGQCLWAIRRFLPQVPVPEIFGWSSEDGYIMLYMEMVKGVTIEERWLSMTKDEKQGFWASLKSIVSDLHKPCQPLHNQFLGE